MKQKLISALVASVVGGLAATSAQAGVIQATYKVFAAEAFGGNGTTVLTAPVVSYNLSRPVSGSAANPNTFKVALTLASGTWTSTAGAMAVLRDPSSSNTLDSQATPALSVNGKTLTFTFIANQDGITYPANSTITFGDSAADHSSAVALFVTGVDAALSAPMDDACSPAQASVAVSIKMTSASGVEVDTNDAGAITATPVFASNVAVKVTGKKSESLGTPEESVVNVADSTIQGKKFIDDGADATSGDLLTINLGNVTIGEQVTGLYDKGGDVFYRPQTGAIDVATGGDGQISADVLNLTVTGKFATGSTVFLATDAACTTILPGAGASATAALNATLTKATFATTVVDGDWLPAASTPRTAYICYTVPGTSVIPTSTFRLASGTLTKLTGSKEVTDTVCPATLYDLGANGIKVDVRNYIHSANTTAYGGWKSVLRLINTDELQTVDVTAQQLDSNGNLLASGVIATLAPRAAKYIDNSAIDAAIGSPLAADANNSRLRITAPGSSLRVQNYIYDPVRGTYIEASSAQGDENALTVQNSLNK